MTPLESEYFDAFKAGRFKSLIESLPSFNPSDFAYFEEVWLNDKHPHKLDILAIRKDDLKDRHQLLIQNQLKPFWELGHLDGRNYYKFNPGDRGWAIEVGRWCDYDHFGQVHSAKRLLPRKFPELKLEGFAVVCKERMDSGDILGMYEDDGIQVFELT